MSKNLLLIVLFVFVPFLTIYSQEVKSEQELIQNFIEKKREFNKKYGYGYRIQLYNGLEVEAKKLRAKFRLEFTDTETYLLYQQPEWKIQVGHYKTRLEADRALNKLKKKYPYAIIVPLGK